MKLTVSEGWRDGSAAKLTGYSSRGPEFNSQQPHCDSQSPVIKSGALFWPAQHVQAEHCIHNKYIFEKEKYCFKDW